MQLLTQELRRRLPPLYSQENTKNPLALLALGGWRTAKPQVRLLRMTRRACGPLLKRGSEQAQIRLTK